MHVWWNEVIEIPTVCQLTFDCHQNIYIVVGKVAFQIFWKRLTKLRLVYSFLDLPFHQYTLRHKVSCLKTSLGTLRLILCTVVNIGAIGADLGLAVQVMGPLPNWFGYSFHSLDCVSCIYKFFFTKASIIFYWHLRAVSTTKFIRANQQFFIVPKFAHRCA